MTTLRSFAVAIAIAFTACSPAPPGTDASSDAPQDAPSDTPATACTGTPPTCLQQIVPGVCFDVGTPAPCVNGSYTCGGNFVPESECVVMNPAACPRDGVYSMNGAACDAGDGGGMALTCSYQVPGSPCPGNAFSCQCTAGRWACRCAF